MKFQWELLESLECCAIFEDGVVNLKKGTMGCCGRCKEGVVTLHKGPVGVVKDLRVL